MSASSARANALSRTNSLAERWDEGIFGEIPEWPQNDLGYDAIASDLGMDYGETTIDGKRPIYRCS